MIHIWVGSRDVALSTSVVSVVVVSSRRHRGVAASRLGSTARRQPLYLVAANGRRVGRVPPERVDLPPEPSTHVLLILNILNQQLECLRQPAVALGVPRRVGVHDRGRQQLL